MTTPQQENPLFQEGRLILSIGAHKQGQYTNFRKATSMYDVPRTTAQRRAKGIKAKAWFYRVKPPPYTSTRRESQEVDSMLE
jgi:hypothetical protein